MILTKGKGRLIQGLIKNLDLARGEETSKYWYDADKKKSTDTKSSPNWNVFAKWFYLPCAYALETELGSILEAT